jgi:DNA-binding transcriptional regulator YiaG
MKILTEARNYQQGKIPARKAELPIKPIIAFNKNDINQMRQKAELCHVVFAGSLGVSPNTAEARENGKYKYEGAYRRFMEIVMDDPTFFGFNYRNKRKII